MTSYIEINVYAYSSQIFLGQAYVPATMNNADMINESVGIIRKAHGKTEKDSYFKTHIIN